MPTTAALIADPPLLHVDSSGRPTLWKVSEDLMHALDGLITEGARTLETGAGLSTLLFATRGCHHRAVVPDPDQAQRITAWCEANGVDTSHLEFVLQPSETALPTLDDEPLDVVLIDGAHGFPAPFIDWFYAGRKLRVGGSLIIDDTQIWTGAVLRDFLLKEPQWELTHSTPMEFAVFRRVSDGPVGEWTGQPYVLQRSFTTNSSSAPRRAVGYATLAVRNARLAGRLIRAGDFATLRKKARQS